MASFAIPMFGGEDPLPWIEKVEYIWCEFELSDAELIDLVFPCLVGKAKCWIEANMNLISEKNWCSLMYNILWEFTKSSAKDTEPLAHELGEVQIVSIPSTEFSKEFDLFASSNVESVKPTDGEEIISIQGEKKFASLDKDERSDCSKDIIEILALSRFEEIPLAIPSPSVDNDIASWVMEDAAYIPSNLLQEKGNSSGDGVNVVSPVTMSTMAEACLNIYTVGAVIQDENMLSSIKAPYYSVSKGARFLANATQYKAGSAMQYTTFIWEPGPFLLLLNICNYMGEETIMEAIICSMNMTVLVLAPQPDAKKVFDCIESDYVVAVFILVCNMFIFSEGVFIRNDKSAGSSCRCSLFLDILYHSFDCQQPVLQCQDEVQVIWKGRTGPQPWDTILVWNNDYATKSLETCTELNAPHPVNFSLKNLLRLLLYGWDNSTLKLDDTVDGIVRGDSVTNLYLSLVYKLPDQAPNGVIYRWCFDPGPAGVRFINLPLLLLSFAMSFHITKSDFDIAELHLTLVQLREGKTLLQLTHAIDYEGTSRLIMGILSVHEFLHNSVDTFIFTAHNFQSMPHYFKFLMARYYVSFDPGIDCSMSYGLRADWWYTALRRVLTAEFATTPRAAETQHLFGYAKLLDCGTDLCINSFVCFQSASIFNHLIAMHMEFSTTLMSSKGCSCSLLYFQCITELLVFSIGLVAKNSFTLFVVLTLRSCSQELHCLTHSFGTSALSVSKLHAMNEWASSGFGTSNITIGIRSLSFHASQRHLEFALLWLLAIIVSGWEAKASHWSRLSIIIVYNQTNFYTETDFLLSVLNNVSSCQISILCFSFMAHCWITGLCQNLLHCKGSLGWKSCVEVVAAIVNPSWIFDVDSSISCVQCHDPGITILLIVCLSALNLAKLNGFCSLVAYGEMNKASTIASTVHDLVKVSSSSKKTFLLSNPCAGTFIYVTWTFTRVCELMALIGASHLNKPIKELYHDDLWAGFSFYLETFFFSNKRFVSFYPDLLQTILSPRQLNHISLHYLSSSPVQTVSIIKTTKFCLLEGVETFLLACFWLQCGTNSAWYYQFSNMVGLCFILGFPYSSELRYSSSDELNMDSRDPRLIRLQDDNKKASHLLDKSSDSKDCQASKAMLAMSPTTSKHVSMRGLHKGIILAFNQQEKLLTTDRLRVVGFVQFRPTGHQKGVTPKFSLAPLVPRPSELLGITVVKADDCIGPDVEKLVAALQEGGVLLESVRFYKEEEKNDPEFAKKLASLADLYVNDAFGTAHRAHASTEGVTKYLKPSVARFLLQKELDYLVGAVSEPKRLFAAIVGGSKVLSKTGVLESLLEKCDILILGGGMIFTFYKAQGKMVSKVLTQVGVTHVRKSLPELHRAGLNATLQPAGSDHSTTAAIYCLLCSGTNKEPPTMTASPLRHHNARPLQIHQQSTTPRFGSIRYNTFLPVSLHHNSLQLSRPYLPQNGQLETLLSCLTHPSTISLALLPHPSTHKPAYLYPNSNLHRTSKTSKPSFPPNTTHKPAYLYPNSNLHRTSKTSKPSFPPNTTHTMWTWCILRGRDCQDIYLPWAGLVLPMGLA